ncbi:MAG: trypsin-like peptidase domain-containing protein [Bdellovibrionales bacterium]|nr:trypsin-like peptidase domain-containing protein [Bdellovibrionales bacterium]
MFKFFAAALLLALPILASASSPQFPKGQKPVTRLSPLFTTDFDFEGIVALSNCSGSLVQYEGASDSDQALILTNGHCLEGGMPRPGVVITDRPSRRRFDLFNAHGRTIGTLNATRLLYATMTGTDMALYRVQETYEQIRSRFQVRPFSLSSQRPTLGTAIEVISGYWERGYRCHIEFFPYSLQEAGYRQVDSIRYSRPGCEVIGGTSGSPIIAAGTRTVIGVNNTGNEDGRRCTMNNPCEIDEDGNVSFTQGYSYGQQTFWVYSCLNAAREIDLTQTGCLLPH